MELVMSDDESSTRDWDANVRAIWPHKAEWVEPRQVEDEDEHGWSIRLNHEGGHETVIFCFEDADYNDEDDPHRARSMHPRLAALVDERFREVETRTDDSMHAAPQAVLPKYMCAWSWTPETAKLGRATCFNRTDDPSRYCDEHREHAAAPLASMQTVEHAEAIGEIVDKLCERFHCGADSLLTAIELQYGQIAAMRCICAELKHAREALVAAKAREDDLRDERNMFRTNMNTLSDLVESQKDREKDLSAALVTVRDDLLVLVEFHDIEPALDHARAAGRRIDAAIAATGERNEQEEP